MQAAVLDFGVTFAEHSRRAGSPSAAALQRTRAILAASMAQAEVQAEDFGRPTGTQFRGVWQWLVAAGAVLLVAGAATFYLKETVAPRITEPAVAAVVIASGDAGVGTNPFAAPRVPTGNAVSVPATGTVRREGDTLVIELHDTPLGQAIAQLAGATQTTVVGQPGDARVSLQWRGTSSTAAWQALLAGEAGYALACDLPETTTNCRVWLAANQTSAPQ